MPSPTRVKIDAALKEAMKARQEVPVRALRFLLADLKQREIDERRELAEEEVIQAIQRGIKKRRETIEVALAQDRADVATAERGELEALERFLPAQLSEEELRALVDAAIRETGATTRKEQGKVMGVLMPRIQGRADGKLAARLVGERLV